MPDAHAFLTTFAVVLCTAAVTTVVFQRLKQPVILGYLLAGLLVGPHVPLLPVVADHHTTETLAELGVILLLFGIGLEFSLRRLMRIGGTAGITGVIAISLIFWLGNAAARILGWNATEALFAGAAMAVSSTTIIGKAFEDRGITGKLRDLVFGVLIVEDLFSILLLAALVPVAAGSAATSGELAWAMLRLFGLLTVTVIVGLLTIPRLMHWLIAQGSKETVLITSVGLAFGGALLADQVGYSVALGAFLAGSLIAESGEGEHVLELVLPVRDVFGAVFFVSVGMLIDPALVRENWIAVLVFTVVVVVGKVGAVSLGAFLAGSGTRVSIRAGMSMAQIGEFSFIIASVGAASAVVGGQLYPVMVAVSALTTLITPWLISASSGTAALVDRKMPGPIQTYMALYGTWLENLRAAPRQRTMGQRVRGKVRWLLIDAGLVVIIIVGAALLYPTIVPVLGSVPIIGQVPPVTTVIVLVMLLTVPFMVGMFQMAGGMAQILAHAALPQSGRLDRAAAPRSALVVTFEIVILLVVGLPMLAITQPFLPPLRGGVLLVIILIVLSILVWRRLRNLDGHVRAGAEALLAAVGSSLPPVDFTDEMHGHGGHGHSPSGGKADPIAGVTQMLPGMGTPVRIIIGASDHAAGQTLQELALRGRTGGTILGITRGGVAIPAPSKTERLEVGDILVLVGTAEAVEAAKILLEHGPTAESADGGS